MTAYDESVIIEFADRLYRRARWIVVTWTLLGGVLAALVGRIAGGELVARSGHVAARDDLVVIVGLIGMLVGYRAGSERAFALRLQAQTALCQAQIERNTRAVRAVEPGPPPIPMRR